MRYRNVTLLWLALALVGYWSPWLTHPAAALRLNGYELSEWVTFLPGVRDGSVPINRLTFFIPLACVAWLLGCGASRFRGEPSSHVRAWWADLLPRTALSWALLALALLCCFMIFPPYEAYVRADYWPEYQTQFIVACLTLAGIALTFILPAELKDAAQILMALVGVGVGAWAFLTVQPIAIKLLGVPWARVGAGWVAMLIGLGGLALSGFTHLFGQKDWTP